MKTLPSRGGDDGQFQLATNSASAELGTDIKRRLARVLVGSTIRPRTHACPPNHATVDVGHNDRISPATLAKPNGALPDRLRFCVKRGGCSQDCLIVDVSDGRQVRRDSSA
jgi:hypothetical protein